MNSHIECDHCGCEAVESNSEGYFYDGQGGACMTCGFPGHVSLDEETDPWWNSSDDDVKCTDPDCWSCTQ